MERLGDLPGRRRRAAGASCSSRRIWAIGKSAARFCPGKGFKLLVLTQPEPDPRLTELRQAARARWGVETIVVGEDAFAFIEIVKRLQEGATVALLMDRPAAPTAVTVNLFGRPFSASIAAAELARASGCAILPACIVRTDDGYEGEIQPEIPYDRAMIGNRAARIQLTQEIMRVFRTAPSGSILPNGITLFPSGRRPRRAQ